MPGHYDKEDKMKSKVSKVMREYKAGKLKSSSGDKVKSRDQAVDLLLPSCNSFNIQPEGFKRFCVSYLLDCQDRKPSFVLVGLDDFAEKK